MQRSGEGQSQTPMGVSDGSKACRTPGQPQTFTGNECPQHNQNKRSCLRPKAERQWVIEGSGGISVLHGFAWCLRGGAVRLSGSLPGQSSLVV